MTTTNFPYNERLEKAVIGVVLMWPELAVKLAKCPIDFFFCKQSRCAYNLIISTLNSNEPIDFTLLVVKADTELKNWLVLSINDASTSLTFDYYIRELRNLYLQREIRRLGLELAATDPNPTDMVKLLSAHLEKHRTDVGVEKTQYEQLQGILDEYLKLKERGNEMEMGFPDIDDKTNGLRRKRLYVLGGAPGSGKTSIALNIANKVSVKKKVLFLSLEMSHFDIIGRLTSITTDILSWKLQKPWFLTPYDLEKMSEGIEIINKLNLFIVDSIKSVADMVERIKLAKPDLVIVDHLQYLVFANDKKNKQEQPYQTISDNIKILRDLAIKNNFCLFLLSQIKRPDKHKKQLPHLTDFQGSSGIEQQADVGIILDCPNVNFPDILEMHIVKNRNGLIGKTKIVFNSDNLKYTEMYDDKIQGGESDDIPF